MKARSLAVAVAALSLAAYARAEESAVVAPGEPPVAPAASAPAAAAAPHAAALAAGVIRGETAFAPAVPPAIARKKPAVVHVDLETQEVQGPIMEGLEEPTQYSFWTFNGHVPGPMIRVRVGDTLELTLTNRADNAMTHDIDLHAVTGPGGGAPVTMVKPGESKTVRFKMLYPGLFVYHCAAAPVTDHIANGMYGMILVEPAEGLPKVDREFYVMQSEFYTKEESGHEGPVSYDSEKAEAENPTYVVFNGRSGSLMGDGALKAKVGETVRIFFGDAGPNKTSSFHVIGTIFDRVWREGGLTDPPAHGIQTTVVPPGGSTVVDLTLRVPGNYTLVDHAIFRLQKGAVGLLTAEGKPDTSIYPDAPKPGDE